MMKKSILLSFAILLTSTLCYNQESTAKRNKLPAVKKLATVNFGEIEDVFLPNLIHKEAPPVSGHSYQKYLADLKKQIEIDYPADFSPRARTRGDAPLPIIGYSAFVGGANAGIPLDNHLAMNNDTIITAINSYVSIFSSEGGFVKNFTLTALANELNVSLDRLFDPRLHFDPVSQRYIAVFLGGYDSSDTNIIVCFSESSNAKGDWHCYALTGNPNMDTTWTDYPMINVTETDVLVTINLLRDGETWQEGFEESLIWQLDKAKGFAGEDLDIVLWDDINYDGAPIRNLCPVESATSELFTNAFFLSNRNFNVETDSIFILELTGGVNDANAELIVEVELSDTPYGVPPNARQESADRLQTNDARILEAFILDDQIQFVGNTRNLETNLAGIYHGIVNDVFGAKTINLTHIPTEDNLELGYPGIVYTGDGVEERDAIIAFNHTSPTRYAGMSALYYLPETGYSDILTIVDGEASIEMIGDVERWGDYLGSQRNFNNTDEAWFSGFWARSTGANYPWAASLSRPDGISSNENINIQSVQKVYPNPLADRFTVEFDIPKKTNRITMLLLDAKGALVDELYSAKARKTGLSEFSFVTSSLSSGMYYLNILLDNNEPMVKKLIVE